MSPSRETEDMPKKTKKQKSSRRFPYPRSACTYTQISIVHGASGIGVQLTHAARHLPLTQWEADEEHGWSLQGEYWQSASLVQR